MSLSSKKKKKKKKTRTKPRENKIKKKEGFYKFRNLALELYRSQNVFVTNT